MQQLRSGTTLALVSDAGTPGISDPGYLLIRECLKNNIAVECLPGPTAFVPALVNSGLPTDRFLFEGFLPHKKGRKTRWDYLTSLPVTFAVYESPHRLKRFLKEAAEYLEPERSVAVVREISKVFESVHRGTASELLDFFENNPSKCKGEIVIVVSRG